MQLYKRNTSGLAERFRPVKTHIVYFMVVAACAWLHASAQTTYVAVSGSDVTGDGSEGNPYLTISNGAAMAAPGDTVLVADGVYTQTTSIYIASDITVRGMHAPTGAVITTMYPDINYSTRCVRVSSQGAVFDGFIIEKGYPPDVAAHQYAQGGGILLEAGLVTNCIIRDNQGRFGGGAALWNSNAVMRNCWISNNICAYGVSRGGGGVVFGDMYKDHGGASLLDSEVRSNTSVMAVNYGGGIYSISANGLISNCLIADNVITGNSYGGGVYVEGNGLRIVDSIISNNSAGLSGGGICVHKSGYAEISGATVTHNLAQYGGGIHAMRTAAASGLLVSNCIVSFNFASNNAGGGIMDGYVSGATSTGGLTVLDTRIFGNNGTRYGGGAFVYTHGTAIFHNCEFLSNNLPEPSSHGAGMYIGTGSACVIVRNCLFAGNRLTNTDTYAGGIRIYNKLGANSGPQPLDARLESCTLVDNEARYYGGMNMPASGCEGWNCLIVSNTAATYPDLLTGAEFIAPFHYSCSQALTNAENVNITNAPEFAGYAAGDYRLRGGSPGVNAGSNRVWMAGAVDLDGHARIDRYMRRTDMGCYEHLPIGTLYQVR